MKICLRKTQLGCQSRERAGARHCARRASFFAKRCPMCAALGHFRCRIRRTETTKRDAEMEVGAGAYDRSRPATAATAPLATDKLKDFLVVPAHLPGDLFPDGVVAGIGRQLRPRVRIINAECFQDREGDRRKGARGTWRPGSRQRIRFAARSAELGAQGVGGGTQAKEDRRRFVCCNPAQARPGVIRSLLWAAAKIGKSSSRASGAPANLCARRS